MTQREIRDHGASGEKKEGPTEWLNPQKVTMYLLNQTE